ncbi:MAG TPA: glutaredoxin family protein [Thermoleophilaceae bacterium]|nr:glutaredoxin family protein [Thermoleophilaceae bacterium]
MPVVTLFGKPGCHLCDEARDLVRRVCDGRAVELREIDITLDPTLNREYGERIPVLVLNGEELFEYFVDEGVLVERLDRVDGS